MVDILGQITNLASFIGATTIIGSALIWVWNKLIGQPREKKREREEEKRQHKMMELVTKENKPLADSIQQLNEWLEESTADRKRLNRVTSRNTKMLENHETRLDNHNERLITLETIEGIQKRRR